MDETTKLVVAVVTLTVTVISFAKLLTIELDHLSRLIRRLLDGRSQKRGSVETEDKKKELAGVVDNPHGSGPA